MDMFTDNNNTDKNEKANTNFTVHYVDVKVENDNEIIKTEDTIDDDILNNHNLALNLFHDEIKSKYNNMTKQDINHKENISTKQITSSEMVEGTVHDMKVDYDNQDMEGESTIASDVDTNNIKVEVIQEIITTDDCTNIDMLCRSTLPTDTSVYKSAALKISIKVENCDVIHQDDASKSTEKTDVKCKDMLKLQKYSTRRQVHTQLDLTPDKGLLDMECGGSETSTLSKGRKRRAPQQHNRASVKKRLTTAASSASSSSTSGSFPPPNAAKSKLFYGSEEDTDDDEGDFGLSVPVVVPRTARLYFGDEEGVLSSGECQVNLEWPPTSNPEVAQKPEAAPISESNQASEETEPGSRTEEVEPRSKFDFYWRAFSGSYIEPDLRRESFSGIDCGPTVPYASPYEAFTAIWDLKVMEHISVETNRYAQQQATMMLEGGTMRPGSRITGWFDTTADELYVYFAIILATGIVVKSRLDEYWMTTRDIFSTARFAAVMSYRRFLLLSKCLHFQNNNDCNPELMSRSEAKLFKVRPILDHLNEKFSHLYNLSRNIALDESLTMWKGWLDINQFLRNRTATVGIKAYEICETQTGYLWRFEVHAGHSTPSQPDDPISEIVPALVLRLLKGLEHKGHTIWMDNFYTSPALARELKTRGFDCAGTLRTNQRFVPSELAALTKDQTRVGQVYACTSGDVDLVVWRDKNLVPLISTYHGLATVKHGDTLKPSIIPDYDVCMGGVDRKDQTIALYPIERRRNQVWYKKLFRRLLNVSVLNAHILFHNNSSIGHRSFRKILVQQLLDKHSLTPSAIPAEPSGHFPTQYDFAPIKKRGRQRRHCVVCGKRTTIYCMICSVTLCPFICFESYHTKQNRFTVLRTS